MSGPAGSTRQPPPNPARAMVVVPTYNERETFPALANAVLHLPGEWRLLIVDDNSPDGTGQLAGTLARQEPRVKVLHRERKEGLGPAYLAGFTEALTHSDVDFICQMDADFSHNPEDLSRLLEATAEADLAIGSRYIRGGNTVGWDWRRRQLSRWGNSYVRVVLGAPIHDITAGFRCWRRGMLEAIELSKVATRGYGFQIEMAYRAVRAVGKVVEVPITFTERRAGKSKMSGSIVTEAIALPWRLRRLK